MANSRLSPRASFFAEIDVLCAAEAMPQRVWGQNLSETGVFLQTTKPFHPGDRLSLRFDISDSEVHVRAAEVVWVKPFEPINVDGTLPGVGVRFLSVDPPTRAAIRRYVHHAVPPQAAPPQDSDVPTPPPEADLPAGEFMSLESLRPLSLPPFESMSERPAFHDVFEDAPEAIADDTAVDVSAPDLSDLNDSTLPDNSTSPPDDYLLEATAPPHDVEHPLSGWRFEVVPKEPAELMPPPDPSFSLEDDEPDVNDTLPPPTETLPPFAISLAPFDAMSEPVPVASRTGFSFEDEQPAAKGMMPAPVSLTPRARPEPPATGSAKAPPGPPPTTELPAEVFTASLAPLELQERGPDVFQLAAHEKVDQEFFDGKLSVVELPQLEQRGVDAASTRKLRIAWAAGLLLAGGGLGVWMGYEPAPEPASVAAASEQATQRVLTVMPAPEVKSVAEAEAELVAVPAPGAATAEQAPAPPSTSAPAVPSVPSVPSVPIVSPEVIATSASGTLPRKDDVALTNTVAVADASPSSVRVEFGRVTIPLEGGRVARSFGLENPPRVVVDLVDATMPSEKAHELDEKGVARVRFGRPDPVHVRVVVELAGDGMPDGITTLKKASTLSVAWR